MPEQLARLGVLHQARLDLSEHLPLVAAYGLPLSEARYPALRLTHNSSGNALWKRWSPSS